MLTFYKYQGTGNDFILIDNREKRFDVNNNSLVKHLCDRRFGIGADGLMLLQNAEGYDFEMIYFNSDGFEGTMCGNGGRCIVAFANKLGIFQTKTRFVAIDGPHDAELLPGDKVRLKMQDVDRVEADGRNYFLNTGSPHYVIFVEEINKVDIETEGRLVRYSDKFKKSGGTNVNFVEIKEEALYVRTYERGVEAETLSCGTGVTAAVISAATRLKSDNNSFAVRTHGGNLKVSFTQRNELFEEIWLEGPATFVFEGKL